MAVFANENKIRVVSANWEGVAEQEGKGIYHELISAIYAHQALTFDVSTYDRAKKLFASGDGDILVGAYKEEFSEGFFAKWHLDMESPILAVYHPERHVIDSVEDMEGKVVAWVKGYNFADYLNANVHHYAVENFDDGLNLLIHGKVDLVLDYSYNMPHEAPISLKTLEVMGAKPIWLVFQNSEKGVQLRHQYDAAIEAFIANGKLAEIYGDMYGKAGFEN